MNSDGYTLKTFFINILLQGEIMKETSFGRNGLDQRFRIVFYFICRYKLEKGNKFLRSYFSNLEVKTDCESSPIIFQRS